MDFVWSRSQRQHFARLKWCVRVCSMHVFELWAPACLPNCFSVVYFVFLCVVVSHLCPHRLILALCNVNCVRTNDLFWVLFLNFIYLFTVLIIYLIGSRVVQLETGFPPLCGKKWHVPMVKCLLLVCSLREPLNPNCGFEERVTYHCLDFLTLRGLYACSVQDMGHISAPIQGIGPHTSLYGQSNPYFGLLHIPVYKLTR